MLKRNFRAAIVIVLLCAAAIAGGFWLGQSQQAQEIQAMASGGAERNLLPVTLPDTFGKSQSFLQWKGKVLLLNFWATWCAPCLEEIPLLIAKQIQYGADGLQIVGIAIDRLPGVQRFMDDLGVNYPVLLAEKLGMNIMRQYGNRGALPFSILFNRQGQLVQTRLGIYKAEELESEIKKLL